MTITKKLPTVIDVYRLFLLFLVSIFFLSGVFVFRKRFRHQPNIVLLVIDTLRADKLGIYGQEPTVSPEIDEIANKGVVFEQTVSQSSWTRSSMASMLTSKYPTRINVVKEQWDSLNTGQTTLAEILNSHGYFTIGITANPQLNKSFGFSQGFDRYFDSQAVFYWMKRRSSQFTIDGINKASTAEEVFAKALEELRRPRNGPVYLQLQLMDVHEHGVIQAESVSHEIVAPSESLRKYLQSIKTFSPKVGDFINELKTNPEYNCDDTIVIITADHGEGLLDHENVFDSNWHGNLLYRSQLWVPLVLHGWGNVRLPTRRIKGLVQLLDIYPTVLDLVGIDVPLAINGASLKDVIFNEKAIPKERIAYAHTSWREGVHKAAAITAQWIYAMNYDHWPGTADAELQGFWGDQNGSRTNLLENYESDGALLQKQLESWSANVGKSEVEVQVETPSVSSIEMLQLKSFGYLSSSQNTPRSP